MHWRIRGKSSSRLDYGKARLWGSVAFVIGSALTANWSVCLIIAILALLTLGVASMLLGFHPSDDSATSSGAASRRAPVGLRGWRWFARTGAFWPAFVYCRGRMRPITVLAPFTGRLLATRPRRWAICGRWAWWRKVIIFALSNKLFRRCSARDMLLISAICGVVRWGIMGAIMALPRLIVVNLHCGTFHGSSTWPPCAILPLASSEVIRLQAVYSAVAMGGSIMIMTVFAGFLYQYLATACSGLWRWWRFRQMFLCALKVVPHADSSILWICSC